MLKFRLISNPQWSVTTGHAQWLSARLSFKRLQVRILSGGPDLFTFFFFLPLSVVCPLKGFSRRCSSDTDSPVKNAEKHGANQA